MGMYDSVLFRCPKCEAEIEVQSKAGPCELTAHHSTAVPLVIAADITGKIVNCPKCEGGYTVYTDVQRVVHMRLI